jgi:hypothetical protein
MHQQGDLGQFRLLPMPCVIDGCSRGQPDRALFSFSGELPELGVMVDLLRMLGRGRWCSGRRSSDGQMIFAVIVEGEDHGLDLRVWVELRGFEPLTPSMRTQFPPPADEHKS